MGSQTKYHQSRHKPDHQLSRKKCSCTCCSYHDIDYTLNAKLVPVPVFHDLQRGTKGEKITFLEALCLHLRLWPVYSDIIVELVRVQVMVTTRNYGIHVPCTVIVLSKAKHPQGIPVYSSHISINYRIMLQAMYTKFSCSYTRNTPITLHSRQLMLALIAA